MLLIALVEKQQIARRGLIEIFGQITAIFLHYADSTDICASRAIYPAPSMSQGLLRCIKVQLWRQRLRRQAISTQPAGIVRT